MEALNRFREAQEPVYATALAELSAVQKSSHWMWFIFPQLRGLGRSATALHFGIADLDEARAYLADPVLGPRLTACARALLEHTDKSAEVILGPVDALKLRSCATLFETAGGGPEFAALLDAFYAGERCPLTRDLLETS